MFLSRLTFALTVIAVSACTAARTSSAPTDPPRSTDVAVASPSPSATTSSSPTVPARKQLGPPFAVLVTGVFDVNPIPRYEVSLVDGNANVVARASAATRIVRSIALPAVSATRTRVYFFDGESRLRSLAADGTQGPVRALPVGVDEQAAVAVSPDDKRIAVTIVSWGSSKPTRAYVEDLDGGGHHRDLTMPQGRVMWPVAWRDGRVVFGLDGRNYGWGNGACPGCAYLPRGYVVVDPDTGGLEAVICAYGEPGDIVRNATPDGVLCIENHPVAPFVVTSLYGWDGRAVKTWALAAGGYPPVRGVLSPRGAQVADMGLYPNHPGHLYFVVGNLPEDIEGEPSGWIDETRLVFRPKSDVNVSAILDLSSLTIVPLSVAGTFVTTLPGGLDRLP